MTVIDEQVSVNFLNNSPGHTATPTAIYWRGRQYVITKTGLHHTVRVGRTLFHIFSVTDGANFFRLQLNTETLRWTLMEIETT